MGTYPRGVSLPGDPGGVPVPGRSVRVALLSLSFFLASAAAAHGLPMFLPAVDATPVAAASGPSTGIRSADRVRVGDVDCVVSPHSAPVRAPAAPRPAPPRPRPAPAPKPAVWL